MALTGRHARPHDGIPSSSMADIAFLLLVFFLVTTTFPKDSGLALALPSDPEPVQVKPSNVLRFAVAADGELTVQHGSSAMVQTIRSQDVSQLWTQTQAENPNLIASLETHPDAAYQAMVDVLDALQTAGADRISLKTGEGR